MPCVDEEMLVTDDKNRREELERERERIDQRRREQEVHEDKRRNERANEQKTTDWLRETGPKKGK